jgi:hypothetical protein
MSVNPPGAVHASQHVSRPYQNGNGDHMPAIQISNDLTPHSSGPSHRGGFGPLNSNRWREPELDTTSK